MNKKKSLLDVMYPKKPYKLIPFEEGEKRMRTILTGQICKKHKHKTRNPADDNCLLCGAKVFTIKDDPTYKKGYYDALDDNNILYGKDAKRFLEAIKNPKPLSKVQKKLWKDFESLENAENKKRN